MDNKTKYTFDELYAVWKTLRDMDKEFMFNGNYVGNICNINPLPNAYIGFINHNDDSECGVEKKYGQLGLGLYTDKGTYELKNFVDEFEVYEPILS
jgi:hypothetical protein